MAKMTKVIDGNTYSRSVTIEGNVVTRNHVTEHKNGKYAGAWHFDFTDCTPDEIMELASRSVLIGSRPKFKASSAPEEWGDKVFKVRDYIDGARTQKSDAEKLADLAGKMSKEELLKVLADAGINTNE